MLGTEKYMKGHIFSDQRSGTISQISYRIDSVLKVATGGMHGYANGPFPPFYQWHEIVHERVIGMCRISYAFVALESFFGCDVIIQYPVVAALLSFWHH